MQMVKEMAAARTRKMKDEDDSHDPFEIWTVPKGVLKPEHKKN